MCHKSIKSCLTFSSCFQNISKYYYIWKQRFLIMTLENGPLNTEQSVMCLGCHQTTEYDMKVIIPVALLMSLFSLTLAQDCCDQVELNVTGEADEYLKNALRSEYAGVYTITDDPELQVNGRQVYMTTPASAVTGSWFLTNGYENDGKWRVIKFHHHRLMLLNPLFKSEDTDAQCPEDVSRWTYTIDIHGRWYGRYKPGDITVTCVKSSSPTSTALACKAQDTACTATDTCCDHGTCQDDAGIDVTGETEGNCKANKEKLPFEPSL